MTLVAIMLINTALLGQSLPDKLNINLSLVAPGAAELSNNTWGYQRSEVTLYKRPKNLLSKTLVFHGFGYVNNNFNFTDKSSILSGLSTNFHDFRYTIIVSSRLKNPRWTLLNAARLTLRSDFRNSFNLGQEVFPFFQSVAQYSVRKDGRLKIGLGLSLNNDLGYYVFAPTGVVNYKSKKGAFTVDLVYPNLTVLYRPNRRTELGLIGNVEGGIYRMRTLPLQGFRPPGTHFQHLQLSASPTFSYRLNPKKPYWLNIRAGYTFLRNLRLLNKDLKYDETLRLDADNNLLFRAGWSWRFM